MCFWQENQQRGFNRLTAYLSCVQIACHFEFDPRKSTVPVTENWKCALVLDLVFKNYRPLSNFQHVSKLTERAVFNQVHDHMVANGVYPMFGLKVKFNQNLLVMKCKLVTNDYLCGSGSVAEWSKALV